MKCPLKPVSSYITTINSFQYHESVEDFGNCDHDCAWFVLVKDGRGICMHVSEHFRHGIAVNSEDVPFAINFEEVSE